MAGSESPLSPARAEGENVARHQTAKHRNMQLRSGPDRRRVLQEGTVTTLKNAAPGRTRKINLCCLLDAASRPRTPKKISSDCASLRRVRGILSWHWWRIL